jgi:TBC domain-containing protein kinase-like protein
VIKSEDGAARQKEILARCASLQNVKHNVRLLQYVGAHLAPGGRLFLFSRHMERSVKGLLEKSGAIDEQHIRVIARGLFEGLCALSSLGLVHRGICTETILVEESSFFVRLADWGMCYATDCGQLVDPPLFLGYPEYSAPETFADPGAAVWKSDVWSAGVCLLEMVTGKNVFGDASQVMNVCKAETGADVMKGLMEAPEMDRCSRDLKELIVNCLKINVADRWDCYTALRCPFFSSFLPDAESGSYQWLPAPFLRSSKLTAPAVKEIFPNFRERGGGHIRENSVDLSMELTPAGSAPVVEDFTPKLPEMKEEAPEEPSLESLCEKLVELSGNYKEGLGYVFPEFGLVPLHLGISHSLESTRLNFLHNPHICSISKAEAKARTKLMAVPPRRDFELWDSANALPASLDLKERDVGYQAFRVAKILPLIEARDRKAVIKEAEIDVPPVLREEMWGLMLNLPPWEECEKHWEEVDASVKPGPSDHQIEVDVPRCNARHELIGTTEGRKRLSRVLKAWCHMNPQLEYWQGLDSLAAPFIALSFHHNEGRSFAMLEKMVTQYLAGMFLQKNTSQLQTQLIIFNQILAYHDPALFLHLNSQQFNPELYAIPWFLTLFTHILAVDATLRLWDFLFLHDSTMIYFISISVMRQLRTRLLGIDFNDLVLFFSELHSKSSLDMTEVQTRAVKISRVTPPSLCTDHGKENSQLWWEKKCSLEDLQQNFSPKISVADLMMLLQQNRVAIIVFDVRSAEEYRLCHMEGSINIVPQEVDINAVEQMRVKNPIIVTIGERGKENELPNLLVEAGIPRVTYVSGGMDALKLNSLVKLVRGEQ